MPESWQTIEQAAVSLRLSVRTVNRHIVAGKLQSRLTEGRREVLVVTSEPGATDGSSAGGSPFADGPVALADALNALGAKYDDTSGVGRQPPNSHNPPPANAITIDQETVLALADNAAEKAEMAVSAYQALARVADAQVQQVRRHARLAWTAVAVMAAGVTGAVGWVTYQGTRLSVEHDVLVEQAAANAERADEAADRSEALRAAMESKADALRAEMAAKGATLGVELAAAKEQAARTEGKLAAYMEQDKVWQARQDAAAAALAASVAPSPAPPSRLVGGPTTQPGPGPADVAAGKSQGDTAEAVMASESAPAMADRSTQAAQAASDPPSNLPGGQVVSANVTMNGERKRNGPSRSPNGEFVRANSAGRTAAPASPAGRDKGRGLGHTSDVSVAETHGMSQGRDIDQGKAQARSTRTDGPTTRPVPSRRKAGAPGGRGRTLSDTSSASTADER